MLFFDWKIRTEVTNDPFFSQALLRNRSQMSPSNPMVLWWKSSGRVAIVSPLISNTIPHVSLWENWIYRSCKISWISVSRLENNKDWSPITHCNYPVLMRDCQLSYYACLTTLKLFNRSAATSSLIDVCLLYAGCIKCHDRAAVICLLHTVISWSRGLEKCNTDQAKINKINCNN